MNRLSLPRVCTVLLALGLAASCAQEQESSSTTPCTDRPPTCEGNEQVYCGEDNRLYRYDCTKKGPDYACRIDSEGAGYCSLPCPATVTYLGYCEDGRIKKCDGDTFIDFLCADNGTQCMYDRSNEAFCTQPCPAGVTSRGQCNGTRLIKCQGETYIDYDCAESGLSCGVNGWGFAYCTAPCPEGVSAFGQCDGNVYKYCDGQTYGEQDCAASGWTCNPNAYASGADCQLRCEDYQVTDPATGKKRGIPTVGLCLGKDFLVACYNNDVPGLESCIASNRECGWDDVQCKYACLGSSPKLSQDCAAYGLSEGQQKCRKSTATGFSGVETCKNGHVFVEYCADASDGAVNCVSQSANKANCSVSCRPGQRSRCTDRGVAADCGDGNGWIDCVAFGASCKEEGDDAFCTCTTLMAAASRCTAGQRYVCVNGRMVRERCTCAGPPAQ